jgi:hypothetical protein
VRQLLPDLRHLLVEGAEEYSPHIWGAKVRTHLWGRLCCPRSTRRTCGAPRCAPRSAIRQGAYSQEYSPVGHMAAPRSYTPRRLPYSPHIWNAPLVTLLWSRSSGHAPPVTRGTPSTPPVAPLVALPPPRGAAPVASRLPVCLLSSGGARGTSECASCQAPVTRHRGGGGPEPRATSHEPRASIRDGRVMERQGRVQWTRPPARRPTRRTSV